MSIDLSSLYQVLVEYRDLGLGATALLQVHDIDAADLLMNQRTEIFAAFERLDAEALAARVAWNKNPEFIDIWHEIRRVDQNLSILLASALDELGREVGRLGDTRRTLKNYRSGESGDTFFTRMA